MKKLLQKLANRFGYRISRIAGGDTADAFNDMQRLLRGTKRPIIFDVGAHHGHVSRHFRALFPTSLIYAFEPFPESFKVLQANTRDDSKIHALNVGLSDREGQQLLHSNTNSATNSLLATDENGARTWGQGLLETAEIVETRFSTADSVVAAHVIPTIDILKLDVQGAESRVMAGSSAICKQGLINLVYSEIIIQPTYVGQSRFDDALSAFYDQGFDLYNIYNMSCTSDGRLRQVDALFTRSQV